MNNRTNPTVPEAWETIKRSYLSHTPMCKSRKRPGYFAHDCNCGKEAAEEAMDEALHHAQDTSRQASETAAADADMRK